MRRIQEMPHFSRGDYVVCVLSMIISTAIGIGVSYYKRRKFEKESAIPPEAHDFGSKTLSEYLLGSRRLTVFPVAMSLIASYISGVTVIGTPSEVYNFGTQYYLIAVAIIAMGFAITTIYLPVFYGLPIQSSYEYLELRFDSRVRTFASFLFLLDELLFLPVILYVPAIAFNLVANANVFLVATLMCVFCVIYTLLGGLKAVVHTDVWQVVVLFLSVTIVVVVAAMKIGDINKVFQHASEGGRLIFLDTTLSMYKRYTVWSVVIGGFFYWTSFNSVNQTMVQRYISMPSLRQARQAVYLFIFGIICFVTLCVFAGLLIYSYYRKCDPLISNQIKNDDQLFPIFVMHVVGYLSGMPGLFMAGVLGAALSSLSVVLNATALVLLNDILKGCFKVSLSEAKSSLFVKCCIVVLGALAIGLVSVIEHLDAILAVATSVTSIAAATACGMFTLGMLVPWCSSLGALIGAICGMLLTGLMAFGNQAAIYTKAVTPQKLNVSLENCMRIIDNTTTDLPPGAWKGDDGMGTFYYIGGNDAFPLFRLSFLWINPIGLFVVILVGMLVSCCTGRTKVSTLDARLFSPCIQRFLPKECFINAQRLAKADPRKHANMKRTLLPFGSARSDMERISDTASWRRGHRRNSPNN